MAPEGVLSAQVRVVTNLPSSFRLTCRCNARALGFAASTHALPGRAAAGALAPVRRAPADRPRAPRRGRRRRRLRRGRDGDGDRCCPPRGRSTPRWPPPSSPRSRSPRTCGCTSAPGFAMPTQLVLVPMLFLLPPAAVPACVGGGPGRCRGDRAPAPARARRADPDRDRRRLARRRPQPRVRRRRRAAGRRSTTGPCRCSPCSRSARPTCCSSPAASGSAAASRRPPSCA